MLTGMTKHVLLRLSATAAIIGGALRVADAFLPGGVTVQVQQLAYIATDIMLLIGLCGIYLSRSNRLGLVGLLGFIASIIGILMVRSSAPGLFGFSSYLTGATVTLLGVVTLSIALLMHAALPKLAPILWIASLIIGAMGLLPVAKSWGVTLAGVAFGMGFVAAGIGVLSDKTASTSLPGRATYPLR
jgi:hypothetical protein